MPPIFRGCCHEARSGTDIVLSCGREHAGQYTQLRTASGGPGAVGARLCRQRLYSAHPRQMGKSSLMAHTVKALQKKRLRSVVIDLTAIIAHNMTAEAFYAGLINAFIQQLKLPVTLDQWWQAHALLSPVLLDRFRDARGVATSRETPGSVYRRIDAMLQLDFADDFFAALRGLL